MTSIQRRGVKFGNTAHRAGTFHCASANDGQTSGVMPSVLDCFQSFDENKNDFIASNGSDNATHGHPDALPFARFYMRNKTASGRKKKATILRFVSN